MDQTAKDAIAYLLKQEGGYSNHRHDRGGKTFMGVTKKYYPRVYKNLLRLNKLGLNTAKINLVTLFYYAEFYVKSGCHFLQPKQAFVVLNSSVNAGQKTVQTWFQRALNDTGKVTISVDGRIGEDTQKAAQTVGDAVLPFFFKRWRSHYRVLIQKDKTQNSFKTGWANRIAGVETFLKTYTPAVR